MKAEFCFLNGHYGKTSEAKISALDRGFLFGEGLFETWRTYRGKSFALAQHLKRMATSARKLGIPFDPAEAWETRTLRLARMAGKMDCGGAVRLTVTRGPGPVSLVATGKARPTRLMLFRPLEADLGQARHSGVGVHLMDFGTGVNAELRQLKTLNYLPAVMGKTDAKRRGCFESLYRLADSTVLEGTTSNFFVVKNGRVMTTPVEAGILPGVTRALVIKLASRIAPVEQRRLVADDLLGADELFITSSTIEVTPVIRVDRRRIGTGQVGPLTRRLQHLYRRHVARSLGVKISELGD
jgi:D-amino acid aminotransferase